MPTFERYYEEGSQDIPRDGLSTVTKRNLSILEGMGYQFSNTARRANFGWAPSYLIYGENPEGKEAVYERRETSSRGAGQTFIWIEGKKTRLPYEVFKPYEEEREYRSDRLLSRLDAFKLELKEAGVNPPYYRGEVAQILNQQGKIREYTDFILRLSKEGLLED